MRLERLAIVPVLFSLAACHGGISDKDAVAKVNGTAIAKTTFEEAVTRNVERYRGQAKQLPPGIEERIKQSVLRRLIDDEIIEQKAKALGVAVTQTELDEKFSEQKKRFRTEQAFQDYLTRSKNTEAQMKDDLRRNLLRDRVVEKMSGPIEVTDEEVQKFYDDNLARFKQPERIKASRILLRVAADMNAKQKVELQRKAEKIAKEAQKSGTNFMELAKKESQGPEAERGGDLNWLTRGRMPAAWDNAAFNLEAGAVSAPIETPLGFEIIKVWEKQPEAVRPLDEVKDTIKNSLLARKRNEKRRDVLRELKATAKVEQLIAFEPPRPVRPTMPAQGAAGQQPPMGHPGMGQPGMGHPGMPPMGHPGMEPMGEAAPAEAPSAPTVPSQPQ